MSYRRHFIGPVLPQRNNIKMNAYVAMLLVQVSTRGSRCTNHLFPPYCSMYCYSYPVHSALPLRYVCVKIPVIHAFFPRIIW